MTSKIHSILLTLLNHRKQMNKIYLTAYKTMMLFPPKLNCNKFIYGKVIEYEIINTLGKFFPYCIDLDNQCTVGSSYKNDCNICISEDYIIPFSIKVCKSPSAITIINKNNATTHDYVSDIKNMNFIILCIQKKRMYVFEHIDNLDEYLIDKGPKVEYKRGIFKYLDQKNLYYDFQLSEDDEKIIVEYDGLDEIQVYEHIYNTFIKDDLR